MRGRSFPRLYEPPGSVSVQSSHGQKPATAVGYRLHVHRLQVERDNPSHSREARHLYRQFHHIGAALGNCLS